MYTNTSAMLVSEWIKSHWGFTIPDFNLLGGAGYGIPNVFAHIIVYMVASYIIANTIFWLYDKLKPSASSEEKE